MLTPEKAVIRRHWMTFGDISFFSEGDGYLPKFELTAMVRYREVQLYKYMGEVERP